VAGQFASTWQAWRAVYVQQNMKRFWNQRAREDAPFYIATWRGYQRSDLDDFFLTGEEAAQYLQEAGYVPSGKDTMVEIGCGIGRMTHGFAEWFGHVHAVDVSGEMIARARELIGEHGNISYYETSGSDLAPISNDSVDFCFSYIVFQHIPHKEVIFGYVGEAARVLRPGGTFHFQVKDLPDDDAGTSPAIVSVKRAYRQYVRDPAVALRRRLHRGPRGYENPSWRGTSVSEPEVRATCDRAGLAVQRVTGQHSQYMWVTAIKQ
jgi:ubiquinone/menaquinone biosynthesis C-methylase UbiE